MTPRSARVEVDAATGAVVQIGTLVVHLDPGGRPVPAELPPRVAGFLGRGTELARLVAAAARHPAVQVTGRPGAGKSALAVEAAHAVRDRFPDGQVAVSLHGHDGSRAPSGTELLGRVLRALDVPDRAIPAAAADRRALYRGLLRERRVLVLADDAASAAQCADLVAPPGGSFTLVTSRTVLDLPGAARLALGDLPDHTGRRILAVGRPDARPRDLGALAQLCGGLPLALRIVAARLALEPEVDPGDLATTLADHTRTLGALATGDRAVRASFGLSYARLSAAERLLFRRCAALPLVDLSETAAVALAGTDTARRALRALIDAHLVDAPVPGRFRLHDLLRSYARERLADDPGDETDAARGRFTAVFLAELHAASAAMTGAGRAWFDAEGPNVAVVAEHLVTAAPAALLDLSEAITGAGDPHLPWDAWSRIQEQALTVARRTAEPRRQATLATWLAIAYRERHHYTRALARLDGVEQLCHSAGLPEEAATAVQSIAEVHRDMHECTLAADGYRRALAMLAERDSVEAVRTRGWAEHGLGDVRCVEGDHAAALRHHRRALRHFEAIADRFGQAWAWHGTGDALRKRERLPAAAAAYRRSLALHGALANVHYAGWTEQNLGEVLVELGERAEAGERFERARRAAVARSDPHWEARALCHLGDLAALRADRAAAGELWRAALTRLDRYGTAGVHRGAVIEQLAGELAARLRG